MLIDIGGLERREHVLYIIRRALQVQWIRKIYHMGFPTTSFEME
jgi:hypothetical protein